LHGYFEIIILENVDVDYITSLTIRNCLKLLSQDGKIIINSISNVEYIKKIDVVIDSAN